MPQRSAGGFKWQAACGKLLAHHLRHASAPLVDLAGDGKRGTCQWYLWELCTMQTDAGPQDQWLGGWYDGTVEFTEDGWKFKTVILDVRAQA